MTVVSHREALSAWSRRGSVNSQDSNPSLIRSLTKRALFSCLPKRRFVLSGNFRRPLFALTFDDGPDPATTPAILAILRRHAVCATFFLLGSRAQAYPALVKSIVEDGHEIGNHSHTHPHFQRLSLAQAAREISDSQSVLENMTGTACRLFRPPYGKLCIQSLFPAWWLQQRVVLWTVDLKDYRATETAEIENTVASRVFLNGDIILYHGMNSAAVKALPTVIEAAKAGGRTGVSVSHSMRS